MKIFFIACLILLVPIKADAYNFLYIHPATGEPMVWESGTTIWYYLDPGTLGRYTNEQAHTLLKEAMKIWENATSYATVPHFEFAGYLPEDVTGTNYQEYVSLSTCYVDNIDSCPTEAQKNLQTVIIFDEDSSILDNELCRITECSASAGARVFSGTSAELENIVQGIAVFGNDLAWGNVNTVMGIMVHELGHLLGLAHACLNQQGEEGQYYPTMMVRSVSDQITLDPDDIAGISALYPSDTFTIDTATIKGQILKSDESPMPYVNVVARNIDDSLCEAYSFLNGRTCDMFPEDECNKYEISGLPAGTYTLEVEEVADDSLALTLAPGLIPGIDVIYGDAEFWNDGDTAGDASYLTSSTITLAAGETREDVDIILNRSEVTDDRIQYIPIDTFVPGPGTRCPEEPPVDYAEMIGIDEGGSGDADGVTDSSSSSGGCSLVR